MWLVPVKLLRLAIPKTKIGNLNRELPKFIDTTKKLNKVTLDNCNTKKLLNVLINTLKLSLQDCSE